MATDPVCGIEIDEAAARAETGQTMHGASMIPGWGLTLL